MDHRDPVRNLAWAWAEALEHDLDGVESELAGDLMRREDSGQIDRRPHAVECAVVMFTQTWTPTELGFDPRRCGGVLTFDRETVVVTGPCGDACVYVAMQLLYHVQSPNRRFFLDLAGQRMRGKSERQMYEGRDAPDLEAFDYEAAGALARVRGAVRQLGAADAQRVASMLKACADDLELAGRQAPALAERA
jgi:hypothetical protein